MLKVIEFILITSISVLLCCGFCTAIMCATCRVSPEGICRNPDSLSDSPLVQCPKKYVCGTAVMVRISQGRHPNTLVEMSFGTDEAEVVFKGCVPADYCLQYKNYELIGVTRLQCLTCKEDGCNLKIR